MAEAQNVLQFAEQDEFVAWIVEKHGYEFDDLLSIGMETFRLVKPGADDLIFYKPGHGRFLVTYGPGVEFINEWRRVRKAAEEDEFDFLN